MWEETTMTENPDDLESILSTARDDLRREVSGVSVPDFSPTRRTGPAFAGAMVLIFLIGGGLFWTGRGGSPTVIEAEPAATTDGTTNAEATTSTSPQPDEPFPFVTDLDVRVPTDAARPDLGVELVDPAFGTTSERLTDASAGEYVTPVQAPTSAFNSDGTLLLLYRAQAGHELLDVETRSLLGIMPIDPSDIEQVYWSPTEPAILFYAKDQQLIRFNVETQSAETLAEFPTCLGLAMTAPPSWDGERFALRCADSTIDTEQLTLIGFRASDSSRQMIAAPGPGELLVSASGDHFVFVDGNSGQVSVFDSALVPTGITFETGGSTVMSQHRNRDVLLTTAFGGEATGSVVAIGVTDGSVTTIVGLATGYPFPPGGTRLSATAAPFVVLAAPEISDRTSWDVLDGEVLFVDLRDDEPVVARLAHNRLSPSDEYFQSAFVAVSRDGSQVVYSTDWGLGDRSDTYLIDMNG